MATLTLQNPVFGYTVEVALPLHFCSLANGQLAAWDDGTAYDVRRVRATWYLSPGDTTAAREFFASTGRSQNLYLNPGRGFYPFGPDKGTNGTDFTFAVTDVRFSGALQDPHEYHEMTLEMVYKSSPSYTAPAGASEGSFALGDVTALMMPQTLFQPGRDYARVPTVSRSGVVSYVDRGSGADVVRSRFGVTASPANSAALVGYLTATARDATFSVSGFNPYLPDTTGTARLMDRVIRVTHSSPNRMTTEIEIMRGPAVPTDIIQDVFAGGGDEQYDDVYVGSDEILSDAV